MGQEKIGIYKALDYWYSKPENPVYQTIFKDGEIVGYDMPNLIVVCKKNQHVSATPHPNHDSMMLVFGKHPIYKFLLEPVGCISNICYSEIK